MYLLFARIFQKVSTACFIVFHVLGHKAWPKGNAETATRVLRAWGLARAGSGRCQGTGLLPFCCACLCFVGCAVGARFVFLAGRKEVLCKAKWFASRTSFGSRLRLFIFSSSTVLVLKKLLRCCVLVLTYFGLRAVLYSVLLYLSTRAALYPLYSPLLSVDVKYCSQ